MKTWSRLAAIAWVLLGGHCLLADPPPSGSGVSTNQNKGLEKNDPITVSSGAYHLFMPLLDLGGPLPLSYALSYRMDQYASYELDQGFQGSTSYFLDRVRFNNRSLVEIHLRNGETPQFTADEANGTWTLDPASSIRYVLKETGPDLQHGWYYLLDPVRERLIIFEKVTDNCGQNYCPGRPRFVMDRNGNRHTYTYVVSDYAPDIISDGLGRTLAFTFSEDSGDVERITDQSGRSVDFTYDSNASDCGGHRVLRSVKDASGGATTFHYDCSSTSAVTGVERPLGNTPYTQAVAWAMLNGTPYTRVTSQTDAYGNTSTFAYSADVNRVLVTDPGGGSTTFEHLHNDGPPTRLTDAGGQAIIGAATANEQAASWTDRKGAVTGATYHAPSGKLASYTNGEGRTTTLSYVAREQTFTNPAAAESVTFTLHDLARIDYADGTHEEYAHDARGNLITFKDRAGGSWTYTRNERGQPLTVTNPMGGVVTYTYHADATLATSADSDLGVTTYAYDAPKRLTAVTRPGGSSVAFAYDAVGRPTSITDERGTTTAYAWDANGNLDAITDPLGHVRSYTQDLMDRTTSETDPLGHAEAYTYDVESRPASFTDRNGHVTTYGYDALGRLTTVTDGAGKAWTTGYDAEGVPASFTTPMGSHWGFETNAIGQRTRTTNPLGATIQYAHDALGRPTSVTDEGGRETSYQYDAGGRLTGATVAGSVSASYTRNSLGSLTRITDPLGSAWDFGTSSMGRRTSHTDPLGRSRTYSYDSRGRVASATRPGGGTTTYTYDAASHLIRSEHTGGPTLDFTYDDAGRLLTAEDLELSYDERGDLVTCKNGGVTFGASYDAGRRLKTVTHGTAMTVTYTYDARNLLTRTEDDLSGAWMTFVYDDDRRLVSVQRSNGVGTTYTYDTADRVKRIVHGALIDLQYTLDARGDVTALDYTVPLDPAELLSAGEDGFTYDAASQVSSPGYAYDASGQRTGAPGTPYVWDGAGRLTGVGGAALAYNGMNDLVTRTESGVVRRYYTNHAVGLHPVVAEKNETAGALLRYYVWSPGGRLLYAVDAGGSHAASFYHFDRLGTTLALTDPSGAVTDAYAYTPQGRLLAHQGGSDQPFTFVGQMGVRQEGSSGRLYHMRARYYDTDTAAFLSRDPVWPDLLNPASLNPYQYAHGNPVSLCDPLGLSIVERAKALYAKAKGIIDKSGAATAADAKALVDSVKSLREAAEKLKNQIQHAGNVDGIDDALAQLQDIIGSLDEIAGAIEGAAASGQSLVNALNGLKLMSNLQNLQGALGKLGSALGKIGDFAGKLGPALAVASGLVDFAKATSWATTWATEGSGAAAKQMQGQDTYKIATILTDDGSPSDAAKTMRIMHEQSQNPIFQAVSWIIDLF